MYGPAPTFSSPWGSTRDQLCPLELCTFSSEERTLDQQHNIDDSIVDDKPLIVLAVCGWNTLYVPHFHCFKQTYMIITSWHIIIHCAIRTCERKSTTTRNISARRDKPTIRFISTIVGVWNSEVLSLSAPLPIQLHQSLFNLQYFAVPHPQPLIGCQ